MAVFKGQIDFVKLFARLVIVSPDAERSTAKTKVGRRLYQKVGIAAEVQAAPDVLVVDAD